jgi:hypothetical protein
LTNETFEFEPVHASRILGHSPASIAVIVDKIVPTRKRFCGWKEVYQMIKASGFMENDM